MLLTIVFSLTELLELDDDDLPEFAQKLRKELNDENFPFIRRPKDIDWNKPPELPDDYDPETDPDVIAWREAQKPPVVENAIYVSNISELQLPRFHFYYLKNCEYTNYSIEEFKDFAGNSKLDIPIFYTDCSRWGELCKKMNITRGPVFMYYAPNGRAKLLQTDKLTKENMSDFSKGKGDEVVVTKATYEYCEQWSGLINCVIGKTGTSATDQTSFDEHIYSQKFEFENISNFNFEECESEKILLFQNGDYEGHIKKYAKELNITEKVCLLNYDIYGEFAYMKWGITGADLPAVVSEGSILLPSCIKDVFE